MTETLAEPATPHRPDPRAALLVTLAWYGAAVVALLAGTALFSGAVAQGCGDECTSDRGRWLLFVLYTGTPALFLAMLVSLVLLWLTVARRPVRSAAAAGTLSAVPLLLLLGGLASLVSR